MPTRTSRAVAGISGAIVEPVVAVLADMGYLPTASALPATAGLVDGSAADRFIDQAARSLGDDALGLHVAERVPMGSLGLVDYALVTSATVREALVRVTRHYGVVTQRVRLSLLEDGAHAVLAFERLAGLAHSRHWMEFSFAIMTERMRQTLGAAIAVEEVSFSHEAPPDTQAHDAFFGVPVRFAAMSDQLGFASTLLDRPLRTASSALAELLDARLEVIDPHPAGDDLVQRVRGAVEALLAEGDPRISSTAARLHVSRRTLQRELARRGTSHAQVLDEVRRNEATALLARSMTVAEVATRLAYADPSAFFRAFRRWTGESPRGRPR